MKKGLLSCSGFLLLLLCSIQPVWSQTPSQITNIRFGKHTGFSRLVFDLKGPKPLMVGPVKGDSLPIYFDEVMMDTSLQENKPPAHTGLSAINVEREDDRSVVVLTLRDPKQEAKYFYMNSEKTGSNEYRLILDFHNPATYKEGAGTLVPRIEKVETAVAASNAMEIPAPPISSPPPPKPASMPTTATVDMPVEVEDGNDTAEKASGSVVTPEPKGEEEPETANEPENDISQPGELSGEMGITAMTATKDLMNSKASEYRDFNVVSGDVLLSYDKPDKHHLELSGEHIGQSDQQYSLGGGRYGAFDLNIKYGELPHQYAYDAKTLYSGVGSADLNINDALQTDLQNLTGDPQAQTNLLINVLSDAESGDPGILRKSQSLNLSVLALDPFRFRIETGMETKKGTRPRFGSFGLANTIELFEPIDSKTMDIRLVGEYAGKNLFLNAAYYYQIYDNNLNYLDFDNPFRIDDTLGGPAEGRIALAPDNQYQGISLSGSYGNLPLHTRLSATASLGWMTQDADLNAFTTNSAVTVPIDYTDPSNLPRDSANTKVDTTLLQLKLSSRPSSFMNISGGYYFFDYDNRSDVLNFVNGYVNSDSLPVTTPVKTLPVSYKKTKTDLDLGFRLASATRLNLNYDYKTTDRTNSEVERQKDHVFGAAFDTRPKDWLDLRLAYDHTMTDIDGYNYQVYLDSGQDLSELPTLRKYNQADVDKDRFRLSATVHPTPTAALSSHLTYGVDNYTDSPFGLVENKYLGAGIDLDWTLFRRLNLHGFYNYEQYRNFQVGRGYFDADGDGTPTEIDWSAEGIDQVNTLGLDINYTILSDRLFFKLSYIYSKVDGKIDFGNPGVNALAFDEVDDVVFHQFESSIAYAFTKKFRFKIGCLWEKTDYSDYNKSGFTLLPVNNNDTYNGAVLSDTLPKSYDVLAFYTMLTFHF